MDNGAYQATRYSGVGRELQDQSIGELVKSVSEQTSQLVRDEMRLAAAELKQKGKRAGVGAGMFGAAGVLMLYGGGALITCLIAALAEAIDLWAAALIVGAGLLTVAGVVALLGKRQLVEAVPPTPEEAMDGLRRDVQTVKEHLR
jgi:membrane protein